MKQLINRVVLSSNNSIKFNKNLLNRLFYYDTQKVLKTKYFLYSSKDLQNEKLVDKK